MADEAFERWMAKTDPDVPIGGMQWMSAQATWDESRRVAIEEAATFILSDKALMYVAPSSTPEAAERMRQELTPDSPLTTDPPAGETER